MPDDDPQREPHVIMWDCNYGLVRITALFKSLRHSKVGKAWFSGATIAKIDQQTMPAKLMSANPGLREISHSITGGAITAQGRDLFLISLAWLIVAIQDTGCRTKRPKPLQRPFVMRFALCSLQSSALTSQQCASGLRTLSSNDVRSIPRLCNGARKRRRCNKSSH